MSEGYLVADTHSALWFLSRDKQLSEAARAAMRAVKKRRVPPEALEQFIAAVNDASSVTRDAQIRAANLDTIW